MGIPISQRNQYHSSLNGVNQQVSNTNKRVQQLASEKEAKNKQKDKKKK